MKDLKVISRAKYLQLEGLLVLAKRHTAALREIEAAAADLTGQPEEGGGYFGHVTDAMSEPNITAEELLRKMEIAVAFGVSTEPA